MMPFRPGAGEGSGSTRPPKEQLSKPPANTQDRTHAAIAQAQSSNAAYQTLAAAETASRGTLPTSVTLYLAGMGPDDKQVARLAKVYARKWGFTPDWFFGTTDASKYISPITGKALSLDEANRFTNNFAPSALAGMLKDQLTYTTGRGFNQEHGTSGETKTIDPKQVAAFARILHRYGGDSVGLNEGIAMSLKLAKDSLNPRQFAQNLEWVQRWMNTDASGYDPKQAVNMALAVTYGGKTMRSIADVQDQIAPGAGAATTKAQEAAARVVAGKAIRPGEQAQALQQTYQQYVDLAVQQGKPVPSPNYMIGPDYWSLVDKEQQRILADQTAFQNSWFNKFIMEPVGYVFVHLPQLAFKDLSAGLVLVGDVAATGLVASAEGLGIDFTPQTEGFSETWKRGLDLARYNAGRIYGQQATLGTIITEPLPEDYHWLAGGVDLAASWYLDPLVIAGGLRASYLEKLVLPGVMDHGTLLKKITGGLESAAGDARQVEAVNAWVDRAGKFASSSVSRRMFENMPNETKMFRQIFRLRGKVEARGTLDLLFMKALRDRILLKFDGQLSEAAWKEWQIGIKAHFSGYAPENTVAAEVIQARMESGFRADQILADSTPIKSPVQTRLLEDVNGNLVPENELQAAMKDAIGIVPAQHVVPGWLSYEIPGVTRLAEYGPRRLVRSALTSEAATQTALGKRIAKGIGINPGRVLEFHGDVPTYIYEHGARWGVFSESELRGFQSEIARIRNSGRGVETRIEDVVRKMNEEGFTRSIKNYNLSDEVKARLQQDLLDPVDQLNAQWKEQAFGVVGDKKVATPLMESQLRNQMFVVDPQVVRAGVRRYISMRDRVVQNLFRAARKDAPQIAADLERLGHAKIVRAIDFGGDVYRGWLRFWKSLTVARPAYIPRVILGDENLRFFATTSSVSDRLLAVSWGHRAAEDSWAAKRFLDAHFSTTIKVGDETVIVPRAGAHEYEAAAAGRVRQADIIDEMVRGRDILTPGMKADGSWSVLEPTVANQSEHLRAMSWDLTMQMRNSEPGVVALEAVRDGKNVAETKRLLVDWARRDNFTTLRSRIGVDPADVETWADQLAKVTHAYTMGDGKLADLALEGSRKKVESYINANVKLEDRPAVHAPTVAEATDGGASQRAMARFTNGLYDHMVRRPEDALNRQPYFSEWKKRGEVAMYKSLDESGLPVKVGGVSTARIGSYEQVLSGDEKAVRAALDAADNADGGQFVYHITDEGNVPAISTEGLTPRTPSVGGPEGVYIADQPRNLTYAAPNAEEGKAILRIRADALDPAAVEFGTYPGEGIVSHAIPPSAVEVLDASGRWRPITEAKTVIPSDIHRVIDHASTQFALGQVERVMFDFTKQSRFTELLQVLFPFPQPFFEGFQAWGHIAYRNPTAIAHARILFQEGVNSGLIRKDPLSGEYVVPMDPYRQALVWTATAFGGDPKLMNQLGDPWVPLANMNMLTSSTLAFGAEGPLGKLIGGVPIPVPGMNPVAASVLMKAFADSKSPLMQGYLYQYGPNVSYLPTVLRTAVGGLFPDHFKDDSSIKSMKLGIIEALHRFGLDKNPDGSPIPLNADEVQKLGLPADTKTLNDIAQEQAQALWESRQLIGMFAPTALRTAFNGQREDYQAWQDTLDANGGNYRVALDQWLAENPSKFMIPVGKTWAGPGYDGKPGVRLQASELTYQLYRTPGIGDFMKANPAWAALMLIGTDPQVQSEQNFMAFSDLIAKGFQSYKNPDEYYLSGEASAVWGKVDVFNKTYWYPKLDAETRKLGSVNAVYNSPVYLEMKATRQQFFDDLYRTDPHWVLQNLEQQVSPNGDVHWDWPASWGDSNQPVQLARADAHRIVNIPGIESLPGVQALRDYVEGTDKIQSQMVKARVTDITSDRAKEAGLWDKYSKLVKSTLAETPDLTPFLTNYFDVRLDDKGNVTSTGDLVFNVSERQWAFSEVPKDLQNNVIALDKHIDEFKHNASSLPWNSYERSQFYAKADNLINRTWQKDPKVMKAWWNAQGVSYQEDYKQYLATKPREFYTAFDYHLVGINLSKKAQDWMQTIADARLEIQHQQSIDPLYRASVGYDAIDAYIADKLKTKNKGFTEAVASMNQWGWGIDNVLGYGKKLDPNGGDGAENFASKADWLWGRYLKAVRDAQVLVNKYGLQGRHYGSDADKTNYFNAQTQARDLAKEFAHQNAAFKEMWQTLTKENGGDPIVGSLVFPDDYFGPVGVTNG